MTWLVFKTDSFDENLNLFNRWNLSTLTIQQEYARYLELGEEFQNAWESLPYKTGFYQQEKWIITAEGLRPLILNQKAGSDQTTTRWAVPFVQPGHPWVAFCLPPEWDNLPPTIQAKALNFFGTGVLENFIDTTVWFDPGDF